jgi:transposase
MSLQQINEELREQLNRRDALIEQRDAVIAELTQTVQKLSGELAWCKRQLFGRKSERYEDPNQPKLFEVAPIDPPAQQFQTVTRQERIPDRRGKREPIPENLRRERIVHEIPEAQRIDPATGGERLRKIGEEVSEKLAFRPGEVYVEQHVRVKYRRVDQENLDGREPEIVTAPGSGEGLARCLAAPSLLAEVVVRKYGDHLPLDRLVKIFQRHGVTLSKASMCRWVQEAAHLVEPLLDRMKERLIEFSRVIQHDDTSVRQLEPGSGQTRTCRFWTAVGEPGSQGHYVLFHYTQTRERAGPEGWFTGRGGEALFAGGYLQADAFGGYNGLWDSQGPWKMIHVGCWAHAIIRRYHCALAVVLAFIC